MLKAGDASLTSISLEFSAQVTDKYCGTARNMLSTAVNSDVFQKAFGIDISSLVIMHKLHTNCRHVTLRQTQILSRAAVLPMSSSHARLSASLLDCWTSILASVLIQPTCTANDEQTTEYSHTDWHNMWPYPPGSMDITRPLGQWKVLKSG